MARPAYQTRDKGSGNGVFSAVLDMVFQRQTAAAAAVVGRNGEGQKVVGGSYHKGKVIKIITQS